MTSPHPPRMMQYTDDDLADDASLDDTRGDECDDLPTPGQWLRSLAGNLALVSSWRVALGVLAHLLVHVADILHHLRHGQTAVLSPSRTGNADHTLRAIMVGRAPMLFGGDFTTGASCRRATIHNTRAPSVIAGVIRRPVLRHGWYVVRYAPRRVLQ